MDSVLLEDNPHWVKSSNEVYKPEFDKKREKEV